MQLCVLDARKYLREDKLTSRRNILFYAIVIGALIIDQATKMIARKMLTEGDSVTVIPGFFDLQLSYNNGAAFGTLPHWTPFFIIVALAAVYAIVKLRKEADASKIMQIGLGLLMGGAIGNLFDRVVLSGRGVTDFLSFHIAISAKTYTWPTFNIADAAIVFGAILVIFNVYILDKWKADRADTNN